MKDNKIRILGEKTELLRQICRRRTGGKSSAEAICKDLTRFLKDESIGNQAFYDIGKNSSPKEVNTWKETYISYLRYIGSASSMKNALGSTGVSKAKFEALPEIIDLYIERFKHLLATVKTVEMIASRSASYTGEIRFSPDVEAKISDLVSCLCSCPACNEPTKTGALDSPETLIVLGRACMIYGPEKNSPRYDPEIAIDFYGSENGIWLCSVHADLVNGKGWTAFPAIKLLEWRKNHRLFVYEKVTGIKSMTGFGFHFETGGHQAASDLLGYINDQEFLFTEPGSGFASTFITEVSNFRDYLDEELQGLKFPVFLARQVSGMLYVCHAFMELSKNPAPFAAFIERCLVFKKVIGTSLGTIAKKYKVQMPARLRSLIPISSGTN